MVIDSVIVSKNRLGSLSVGILDMVVDYEASERPHVGQRYATYHEKTKISESNCLFFKFPRSNLTLNRRAEVLSVLL